MTQAPQAGPARRGRRPSRAPQAGPARPGRPWRAGLRPLRSALGLFTILPVGAAPEIGRDDAARAVLWLPVAGLLLSVPAAGVLLAVQAGGDSAPRRLLAAALAVGVLALLTGGLHLDGLADTADGLGSRRPRDEALAIMRRSDVGPFGVAALVFTVLVQVTALATVAPGRSAAAALAAAAVTGRVGVVLATGPGSPAARPDGFGALVAGATTARARIMTGAVLPAAAGAAAAAAWGWYPAVRAVIAVLAGLCAAGLLRRLAVRRLGGMTGDVFGALVEVSSATVLLALALTA
jgi:adenosylcobinamide-GDP ribazoletransferase